MVLDLYRRMDEVPVMPPFLVRDVDARRVAERHRERMARQGVTLRVPRGRRPLGGMAAVGLIFDQQEALLDALAGDYTARHWADVVPDLRRAYPALGAAFDAFAGDERVSAADVRRMVPAALRDADPLRDGPARALEFLYRGWQVRQQVVVEGRPMSLVPVVSGDTQGDTPSFTPVVKRMGAAWWRMGWPGDPAPYSPREFAGDDVRVVLPQVWAVYSEWYQGDQERWYRQVQGRAGGVPDHIYHRVWAARLHDGEPLGFGVPAEVTLHNVSHARLFRVVAGERQVILKTSAQVAVRLAIAAGGQGFLYPPAPDVAEVEAAYLGLIARRGEQATMVEAEADTGKLAPLTGVEPDGACVVRVSGPGGKASITVAWLSGHPAALAIVSGDAFPARAALVRDRSGQKLGLIPFSFKTRKLDKGDVWAGTPVNGLSPGTPGGRRALSAWAAWVWQGRAGQKRYQPGGKR